MKILRQCFWYFILVASGHLGMFLKVVVNRQKTDRIMKLNEIVCFANLKVPFYRGRLGNVATHPKTQFMKKFLLEMHTVDKTAVADNPQNFISDNYRDKIDKATLNTSEGSMANAIRCLFKNDYLFKMTTGGTTGTPLTCYKNKISLIMDGLLFLRGWYMMGWKLGDKALIFYHIYYGKDLKFFNKLSWLTGIKLMLFDIFSDETAAQFIEINNGFRPDIVVTFPSYMYDTALVIERRNLVLTHFPKAIEVSGETFLKYQREKIEKVFCCEAYDSYGTIELGMVAHECEHHNGMHIYQDIVFMESLKNEKRKKSMLVATRYDSREMPLIRYKTGDIGVVVTRKCKCGLYGPILKDVQGRVEDYILLPQGKRIYPSLFRQIISFYSEMFKNSILESRVVQKTMDRIEIHLVVSVATNREKIALLEDSLKTDISKVLPQEMNVEILFFHSLRDRKKFRFIERFI